MPPLAPNGVIRRRGPGRSRAACRVPCLVLLLGVFWSTVGGAFDLEGHRGARGLAPENTMVAYRLALALGVTTVETDMAVTKDGVVVLAHDPDLNPAIVRDASGRWLAARGPMIRTLSAADLGAYDIGRLDPDGSYAKQFPQQKPSDGERYPTLDALIALVKPTAARIDIETKVTPASGDGVVDPATFVRLVLERLRAAGFVARTTLQSFDWRTLVLARRLDPDLETACLTSEMPNFDTVKAGASGRSPWHAGLALADHGGSLPRLVQAAGCAVWSADAGSLTRQRIDDAHALRLKVLAWTVNDTAEMARLLDLGVDGIITDYPDRLARLLEARGIAWR
jgi:glycerophosphoryl diester phosphodiesterase